MNAFYFSISMLFLILATCITAHGQDWKTYQIYQPQTNVEVNPVITITIEQPKTYWWERWFENEFGCCRVPRVDREYTHGRPYAWDFWRENRIFRYHAYPYRRR